MNSREWKKTRVTKLTNDPLCESCRAKGRVVAAACVHHIVPVESGRDMRQMRQLAFQYSNLQSLCYSCHAEIHKAEHSHMVSKHKERMQQRLERWKEIHTRVREVAAKIEDLDKQKQ